MREDNIVKMTGRNIGIYILVLIAFLLGCKNDAEMVEIAEHPVLRTETAAIPAEGRVKRIEGKALLLKKSYEHDYKDLILGETINDGDILMLYENSILVLSFSDGQEMVFQSNDKNLWFTIKVDKPGK